MSTPALTLGVTVILYHLGGYVGSSYRECPLETGGGDCQGTPVSVAYTAGEFCSKVSIDYVEPGTGIFRQPVATHGSGCP
ncbi:hypothetical protein RCH07_000381 [Arthrobacter sp. CG_A4]|nr:hypothetical protein [Arthrobacter sp. CG_A4]